MKKSVSDRVLDWGGAILVTAILCFVMMPFLVVAIASFNDGAILSFPPRSWSFRWYANAFQYRDFGAGLVNSLKVAALGASSPQVTANATRAAPSASSSTPMGLAVFDIFFP